MNSPLHGVLVSVRNLDEACRAQAAGVDLIDLKEPADGALGGLPCALIREVVTGLRGRGHHGPLSATIGDVPMTELDTILARVQAVAATGVDIVKVGITSGPEAAAVIDALAPLPCAIIPVFLADDGLDPLLLDRAHRARFPALMLDTARKDRGSLFDVLAQAELRDFVSACHRHGQGAGLAGALRFRHLADLAALSPDYVGFRSAVCIGDRAQGLQTDLARALMAQAATWGLSRKRRPHAIDVPMGDPVSQLRSVST